LEASDSQEAIRLVRVEEPYAQDRPVFGEQGSESISMTCNRNTTAAAQVTWWTGYSGPAAL
jgi:hypothetical protein